MEFENSKQAAERLGVTVRAIQKWAKQGRIKDAYFDRFWYIPKSFTEPIKTSEAVPASKRYHLPLLRCPFKPGKAREFIDSIPDPDDRNIALSEYYYYTGHAEKSAELAEQYIDSEDEALRHSANVMCTFANIFRGHINLATFYSDLVTKDLEKVLQNGNASKEVIAIGVLTAYIGKYVLNVSVPETPPLEEYLHFLPQGIRIYGCYILAYKAYIEKNYEKAIGICDTALAVANSFYPIASIYVLIIAAASCMSVKKTELAKKYFMIAWEVAKQDGLIKLFGIHHNLLQGLINRCLKRDYPNDYKRIMKVVREFNDGWHRLHQPEENNLSHTLEPIEITVALLYNRDWRAKEIAEHLNISESRVRNYVRDIYDKLNISNKNELQAYFGK